MAKSNAVWGIDIGQCALKALRCRPHDKDRTRVVAESFDYVEYSKILSQPEADRGELVAEAVEQFVSRNDLKGDRVAVSVPGQTGLARFIKLPPVESKKIPDIVKYEARQQIPFSLEDVVWDYQQLAGGSEEEGFALETEVGLFAMKRDQVSRSLEPFADAGIDVDVIQLAPLAIYNFLCFDQLGDLGSEAFDPENPPPSTVVISLGTDTTDLVVTNGYRVWQRNIPIGGNHFTKALSKELKLTFSKAEHLKRHATQADDPKAVFQAMRPVFSDLLAEIQRSIGYFTSIDKTARIGDVVALGNAMKLPGLQRYLTQNLEQDVRPIKEFKQLVGGSVTAGPQFKDNLLSYPVSYGLCVQGLGLGELSTNLLPEEIITQRLIRAKKPWAVAGIAALLLGCTVNYVSWFASFKSADLEAADSPFKPAMSSAQSTTSQSSSLLNEFTSVQGDFDRIELIGKSLVSNVEGRLLWLEVLKAIDASLPKAEGEIDESDFKPEERAVKLAEAISQRTELHIESIDCQHFDDLGMWFTGPVAKKYERDAAGGGSAEATAEEIAETEAAAAAAAGAEVPADQPGVPGAAAAQPGGTAGPGAAPDAATDGPAVDASPSPDTPPTTPPTSPQVTPQTPPPGDGNPFSPGPVPSSGIGEEAGSGIPGPTGPGWVIQIDGHHFHNGIQGDEGAVFVRNTLLQKLREGSVMLPVGQDGEEIEVPLSEIGISHPVLIHYGRIHNAQAVLDSGEEEAEGAAGRGGVDGMGPRGFGGRGRGGNALGEPPPILKLRRLHFVVQFCWKPTPPTDRAQAKADAEAADGVDGSIAAADGTSGISE